MSASLCGGVELSDNVYLRVCVRERVGACLLHVPYKIFYVRGDVSVDNVCALYSFICGFV